MFNLYIYGLEAAVTEEEKLSRNGEREDWGEEDWKQHKKASHFFETSFGFGEEDSWAFSALRCSDWPHCLLYQGQAHWVLHPFPQVITLYYSLSLSLSLEFVFLEYFHMINWIFSLRLISKNLPWFTARVSLFSREREEREN